MKLTKWEEWRDEHGSFYLYLLDEIGAHSFFSIEKSKEGEIILCGSNLFMDSVVLTKEEAKQALQEAIAWIEQE